jgi:hypothetical protein
LGRTFPGNQLSAKRRQAGEVGIVDAIGKDVAVGASLTCQLCWFGHLAQHEVSRFLWRAPDLHRNPQRNTIWPGPQGARQFDRRAQLHGVRSLEVDAGELDHGGHRHMAAASYRQHQQNGKETVQQESGAHWDQPC